MYTIQIDQITLLASTIIGFLIYNKINASYLKIFPFILLTRIFILILEKLFYKPTENNIPLYNALSIIEFIYFLYFFHEVIPSSKIKSIIKWLIVLLPIGCILNIFMFQGIHTFHTYTFTFGSLILVICSAIYFVQIFQKAEIISLEKEPSFWLSIAILFYFTAINSIMGIINYAASLPKSILIKMHGVLLTVNCLFYFLIVKAFLCQSNIQKFTRNSQQI